MTIPLLVRVCLPESIDFLLTRRATRALDRVNAACRAPLGHPPVDEPGPPRRRLANLGLHTETSQLLAAEPATRELILLGRVFLVGWPASTWSPSWTPTLLVQAGLSARPRAHRWDVSRRRPHLSARRFSASSPSPASRSAPYSSCYLLITGALLALFITSILLPRPLPFITARGDRSVRQRLRRRPLRAHHRRLRHRHPRHRSRHGDGPSADSAPFLSPTDRGWRCSTSAGLRRTSTSPSVWCAWRPPCSVGWSASPPPPRAAPTPHTPAGVSNADRRTRSRTTASGTPPQRAVKHHSGVERTGRRVSEHLAGLQVMTGGCGVLR